MDTYLKLNTTSVKNTRTDYEDVQEAVAFSLNIFLDIGQGAIDKLSHE